MFIVVNELFKEQAKYILALGKSLIACGFEISESNLKLLFKKAQNFLEESSDSDDEIEKKTIYIGNERSFSKDFVNASNQLKTLVQKDKLRDLTNLILVALKKFLIQNQSQRKELSPTEQVILNKLEDGLGNNQAPVFKKLVKDDLHNQKEQIIKTEKMMNEESLDKFVKKALPDILTAIASILLPDGWNKELAKSEKNIAYQKEGKPYKAAQDEDKVRFKPDDTPNQNKLNNKKIISL